MYCETTDVSALRELEALAGAGLAGLLALFLARIAGEVAGLLERGAQLGIHLLEGAGDAVGHGAGLAADAATGDVGHDVDLLAQADGEQRGGGQLGTKFSCEK
jgi:hypothetical protein